MKIVKLIIPICLAFHISQVRQLFPASSQEEVTEKGQDRAIWKVTISVHTPDWPLGHS